MSSVSIPCLNLGKVSTAPRHMRIDYDKDVDALSITFRKGKVEKTVELAPEINLDLDAKGRPLYLEIIGAAEKLGKKYASSVQLKNLKVSAAS